jgi:hypothetical protein
MHKKEREGGRDRQAGRETESASVRVYKRCKVGAPLRQANCKGHAHHFHAVSIDNRTVQSVQVELMVPQHRNARDPCASFLRNELTSATCLLDRRMTGHTCMNR